MACFSASLPFCSLLLFLFASSILCVYARFYFIMINLNLINLFCRLFNVFLDWTPSPRSKSYRIAKRNDEFTSRRPYMSRCFCYSTGCQASWLFKGRWRAIAMQPFFWGEFNSHSGSSLSIGSTLKAYPFIISECNSFDIRKRAVKIGRMLNVACCRLFFEKEAVIGKRIQVI